MKRVLLTVIAAGSCLGLQALSVYIKDGKVVSVPKAAQSYSEVERQAEINLVKQAPAIEQAVEEYTMPPVFLGTTLPGGSYRQTCRECRLDGTLMRCICKVLVERDVLAEYDVTQVKEGHEIVNCNGELRALPTGYVCKIR